MSFITLYCFFQSKTNGVPNYFDQKYNVKEDEKNIRGSYSRKSNPVVGDPYKEGNNRNIYSSQSQRLLYDEDSNSCSSPDQKPRKKSYDFSDKETEWQRKFSMENKSSNNEKKGDESKESLSQSRSERIHQLRAKHQKKHVERKGQYPFDDKEEKFEQAIQQVRC